MGEAATVNRATPPMGGWLVAFLLPVLLLVLAVAMTAQAEASPYGNLLWIAGLVAGLGALVEVRRLAGWLRAAQSEEAAALAARVEALSAALPAQDDKLALRDARIGDLSEAVARLDERVRAAQAQAAQAAQVLAAPAPAAASVAPAPLAPSVSSALSLFDTCAFFVAEISSQAARVLQFGYGHDEDSIGLLWGRYGAGDHNVFLHALAGNDSELLTEHLSATLRDPEYGTALRTALERAVVVCDEFLAYLEKVDADGMIYRHYLSGPLGAFLAIAERVLAAGAADEDAAFDGEV